MTKSEYPPHSGVQVEQPSNPADPMQQPLPPQPVAGYAAPVAPLPPQTTPAQPLPPQMVPVNSVPPLPSAMAPVSHTHEVPGIPEQPVQGQPVYGEYAPAPVQPAALAPEQYIPAVETPVDDYHYPQGQQMEQPGMPEMPAVAVPPSMNAADEQVMQAQQAGVTAGNYTEPAVPGGAGEQISQRLAQLQSQYDDELSGAVQSPPEAAPQYAQQINDLVPQFQAPVEEANAFEPVAPAEPPQHQFAQPVAPATGQYAPAPPVSHEYEPAPAAPMSHEYAPVAGAPTTTEAGQPHNAYQEQFSTAAPGIAQEEPVGGGGFRKLALGGAFVAALAVGGGAAYTGKIGSMFGDKAASGATPTIKATSSPIKVNTSNLADAGASINKAVHNRLGGGEARDASGSGVTENIVQKTDSGIGMIRGANTGMMPNKESVKRSISIGTSGPRRVKTLIVRPDGTILTPAGSPSTNVSAEVPRPPSSGIIAETLPANAGGAVNPIRRIKPINPTDTVRRRTTPPRAKVVSLRPKPMQKIRVTAPSAPAPRRAAPAVATPGDIGTPFVVQVTSRTSQTGALAAFADMQQKYPSLIGEFAPDIQRADLGSKGVWYRLRVGPVNGKSAAADLCSNLKQAGHPGCFVRRK